MRRRSRGFTLVELAVVVVIVAVLAVLGLMAYRHHKAVSRLAEATQLIGAIRTAQNEFKEETGVYANVSKDATSYYPAAEPGPFVTAWGGSCSNCLAANGWTSLNVHPSGPVMYGYATS